MHSRFKSVLPDENVVDDNTDAERSDSKGGPDSESEQSDMEETEESFVSEESALEPVSNFKGSLKYWATFCETVTDSLPDSTFSFGLLTLSYFLGAVTQFSMPMVILILSVFSLFLSYLFKELVVLCNNFVSNTESVYTEPIGKDWKRRKRKGSLTNLWRV